jgi:hypothetical protein
MAIPCGIPLKYGHEFHIAYGQVLNFLTTAEYNFLLNTQSSKNLPYLRLGCSQLARWSQLQPIFLYYSCRYKNVYAEKLCHAACAHTIYGSAENI